ncbi:HNH endonuclease [Streptomyces sp. CA-210063]|uniref:HNH endonuclease n=1 Tax=Streptomyces sp. CA-210063 TaxID=2801029 RepID=UPI00214C8104|nr:HNH endonuclease [Streptomyces sp. CA-210063]UUU30975.1 HNH endonuclease [Streptomyces sp. CA-210063]
MWPLDPPSRTGEESYRICISLVRQFGEERRKTRLIEAAETVKESSRTFRDFTFSGRLHDLQSSDFQIPEVDARDAVKWLYVNGMVRKGGPCRVIYDELMAAPTNERCPMCGHGIVRQLDHVMPKSKFPTLCIDPLNLVPACSDCNTLKGDYEATCAENTLLHPYVDRIDSERWLHARVIHDEIVRLEFFALPPTGWDDLLSSRVDHHFALLRLGSLYAVQANRTLANIRQILTAQFRAGGETMVRDYLASEAHTRLAVHRNGWEGVAYDALASDERFVRGAFLD